MSSWMNVTILQHRALSQFSLKTNFQQCKQTSAEHTLYLLLSKILVWNVDSTLPVHQKCLAKSRKLHKVKPPDSIPAQSKA